MEIYSAIAKKIRRYKMIEQHWTFVNQGKFVEARYLLKLLRNGRLKLGLSDEQNAVELFAENIGCHISYSRNYNTATIFA